jgi:hypothetical protein
MPVLGGADGRGASPPLADEAGPAADAGAGAAGAAANTGLGAGAGGGMTGALWAVPDGGAEGGMA